MTCQPIRWTHRLGGVVVAGIATAVLLGGCGGSDSASVKSETASTSPTTAPSTSPTTSTPTSAAAVTVKQFQFMPAELTVKAGTTVTWTNQDQILHTATFGATPGTADGTFDGPMDGPGKSVSHTFDRPGRYPYFCSRHNFMTGTIVVE
jgi:plastocyanin